MAFIEAKDKGGRNGFTLFISLEAGFKVTVVTPFPMEALAARVEATSSITKALDL